MVSPVDSKKRKIILGIETSCDETAIGIVAEGREVISHVVASQVELHRPFGGVIPELASRAHLRNLPVVFEKALEEAKMSLEELSAIAVTQGPGLVGALLTGINYAKGLSVALGKPLIAIDHLEAHVYSAKMEHPDLSYPYLCLLVSGGHTGLYIAKSPLEYEIIGETLDDAVGEAFDKVAALLNLPYPGGPSIEKAALRGNPKAFSFPRPFLHEKTHFHFSFSGLKTAVLYATRGQNRSRTEALDPRISIEDVAASFQAAAVEVLVERTVQAAKCFSLRQIALGGGVARNRSLRERMIKRAKEEKLEVFFPSPMFCTDNGVMIAALAYHHYQAGHFSPLDIEACPT